MKLWEVVLQLMTAVIVAATKQQKFLGINDATAFVGRFFNCTIPEEAFDNDGPLRYEVSEAGKQKLPKWLHFDDSTHSFIGVPLMEDVGRTYISVKTYPTKEKDGLPSITKDVFSIEVSESGLNLCQAAGDVGMAVSVVINAPLTMKSWDRVRLLTSATNFLGINTDSVELSEVKSQESALDPKAIRAGAGDAKRRDSQISVLQFPVGCSGKLSPQDESFITTVEKSAADGTLSDAIGYRIVGWQVIESSVKRQKRYVTPYRGTPIPWVRATLYPIVTERFFESTSEATPESRIVPTMVSPDFFPPTHPHRHHHGQEPPLRRESLSRPTIVKATPTWKYHTLSTIHHTGGTLMPTPAVFPERATTIFPSRVLVGDPTVTLMPSASLPPVDIMSRWYDATTDYATVDIIPTRSRTAVEPTKTLPQSPNFKPTVNNRMKKLSLVCGKAWSYTVPSDTFFDLEDGNTRALKLMFTTSERTSIPASSWIQFDPENQLLYALPLSDNIGRHEYVLEAMDKEGASTFDHVELHVWPHPAVSNLAHSFSMTVRYNKWQYPVGIDWQTEILNRLALFFGDPDNSRLVVLSVTLDPVRITWANDSFATSTCPLDDIRNVYESIATSDQHPSREMKKLMLPEFRVQEISVDYKGSCEGVVTSPMPPPNFSPKLRRPIKRINVTVGDVLRYKIPDDAFYDFEDGTTRNLRLSLLSTDDLRLPKTSWIQFDPREMELYGVAAEEDIGRQKYRLTAMDTDGHSVSDTFEVHVSRLPQRMKPPVEFSVHLEHDFDDFIADAAKKSLVAFKIAHLYGDMGPHNVLVRSISRGSVVYAWSNKTLPHDQCPNELIAFLVSYIMKKDGTPTAGLIHVMEPEFHVTQANVVGTGVCIKIAPTFVTVTTISTPTGVVPEEPDATVKSVSTTDDIYVTTVLPAAVIAAILLVAIIVAYCLYWRKRKVSDKAAGLDIDKEFVGGGVPVVFAGELEEQKPDPGKAPAIMPNEKPPLTTDYLLNPFRRGAAAVRETMASATQQHQQEQPPNPPQQMHHHHHHHDRHQPPSEKVRERRHSRHEQRKEAAALYEPPPPFAHGRESKNNRPRPSAASYSRHPTYVPP